MERSAGPAPYRRPRQLLRGGGAFAAGDARDDAHPGAVRRGPPVAQPVRAAHGRGPGGAGVRARRAGSRAARARPEGAAPPPAALVLRAGKTLVPGAARARRTRAHGADGPPAPRPPGHWGAAAKPGRDPAPPRGAAVLVRPDGRHAG